jgi:hypothetical protein
VSFDITDQLLIRFAALVRYWWEYNETVHLIFIGFRRAYDSVGRKVSYYILIEFEVTMKLVRMIKMCFDKTYSKVRMDKHLSYSFHIQNCLTQ